MIYIGGVYGGPEIMGSPVDQAIAKLTRAIRRGKAESLGDFGSLDVVFHVAGSLLKPEHTGVRTGRFSKRQRLLQVQVAIPTDVVATANPYPFVARGLVDAIKAAAAIFARAGIPYPLDEYIDLAERAMRLEVH